MPGSDKPRRLGPYELVRELGRGGFAEVWLARRMGPGGFEARFAIKTVRTELRTDPAFRKMFLDEAKLAAQINHPNVVTIFELGEVDDLLYLVMEYVRGRTLNVLKNMMQRAGKPVPVGIVMRVLADICAGLHAAHELERDGKSLGVIHRDVSPQNILVSDKGIVKLIDFGVAKANDRLAADTTHGHAKGKLRYMAPEQAMAKPVDRRADVWAVGAVAFDLIEGHPPYDGHNDLARLFRLMDTSPPPSLRPDVPEPIARVIQKALERDPKDRWQTAAEMRTAIESALDECQLRINADSLVAFFGDALEGAGDDDDDVQSDGAVLRARLKRPSMREAMATVDVPAPDGGPPISSRNDEVSHDEAPIETFSALNTSPHGVPRRSSRVVVAAIVAASALAIGALALGLRHEAPPDVASPGQSAPIPTADNRAVPDPTGDPSAAAAPDDGANATASSASVPSFVAPPSATSTERRKPTAAPGKTSRPRPKTTPSAAPGSRPRYDDTIQ